MSVRLILALHFHQPIGNFDSVFEEAVAKAYLPILDQLERHPGVRAGCHLSGCLLEWLEDHDRPFLDRLTGLVGRGQVEPIGGGFYEPILPILPRADVLDQIGMLRDWWVRRAGRAPEGAWIAERVWEPGLAEILADAEVRYTILDDQHLRFAGLLDERFSGAFVTERGGRGVAFFPSDFQLRYLIPFRPLAQLRRHLEDLPADRDWALTYGDDAEKFGLWPGTAAWVHGEGWLEGFFDLLEEGKAARAETPGAYLASRPPLRRAYVPNASYTEMLEWALPADATRAYGRVRAAALARADPEEVRAFVRGPLWDMFLARYPEADQMHKHALWTSRRTRALPAHAPHRAAARRAALRGQCNCPYWHGLFGGIYFPHLRHGAYSSLLEADALLAAAERPEIVRVETLDLDGDLEPEVIVRSAHAQAFFRPSDGGTLVELDLLPRRFNVTNIVSRWREAYHHGADQTHAPAADGHARDAGAAPGARSPHEQAVGVRAADLAERIFDDAPLRSLRDFVSPEPPGAARLARLSGMETLRGPLAAWSTVPHGWHASCRLGDLSYARTVVMDPGGGLEIEWNAAPGAARGAGGAGAEGARPGWFGTLFCLTLLTGEASDRAVIVADPEGATERGAPGAPREAARAALVTFEDRAFGFALDLEGDPAPRVALAPIETLQRSEDRVETIHQGTLCAFAWPRARLASGPVALRLRWRLLS